MAEYASVPLGAAARMSPEPDTPAHPDVPHPPDNSGDAADHGGTDADRRRAVASSAGWVLSVLVVAFLIFAMMPKVLTAESVIEMGNRLAGYPRGQLAGDRGVAVGLHGSVGAPRTSAFDAVLVTGHLGGAGYANVVAPAPAAVALPAVYVAVLLWLELHSRSTELRRLVRVGYWSTPRGERAQQG